MKHLKQEKREDLYWVTALQDKLKPRLEFYKGKERTWLDSIILSCDAFARAMFAGVDEKEAKAVLNFSRTVRPILYTDQLHPQGIPKKDLVQCASDDVFGLSEYALLYCKQCPGDFDKCELRGYLRNTQVPPFCSVGPCEYFQREAF